MVERSVRAEHATLLAEVAAQQAASVEAIRDMDRRAKRMEWRSARWRLAAARSTHSQTHTHVHTRGHTHTHTRTHTHTHTRARARTLSLLRPLSSPTPSPSAPLSLLTSPLFVFSVQRTHQC
jgi:hypothetical protein